MVIKPLWPHIPICYLSLNLNLIEVLIAIYFKSKFSVCGVFFIHHNISHIVTYATSDLLLAYEKYSISYQWMDVHSQKEIDKLLAEVCRFLALCYKNLFCSKALYRNKSKHPSVKLEFALFFIDRFSKLIGLSQMSCFVYLRFPVYISTPSSQHHSLIIETNVVYDCKFVIRYCLFICPKEVISRCH